MVNFADNTLSKNYKFRLFFWDFLPSYENLVALANLAKLGKISLN